MRQKQALSCTDDAHASLDKVLRLLSACLTQRTIPPLPPELERHKDLIAIVQHITQMREALAGLSHGDFHMPVAMHGYTGGLLKEIQGNVRHMLWMISQVAAGNLFHHVDCMGDFADSFNSMTRSLQEAQDALERQKDLYANLADELRVEVAAKNKAQQELKDALERQRALASTDSLTGIANRRFFLRSAHREWKRCRRSNTPFCLSMLDVDHFKDINDMHGHQVGDMVLCHVAAIIVRKLREYDIIGRYGGDEFIILFPDTHLHDAANTLERLHNAIKTDDFAGCGGIPCTISAGLAAISPRQEHWILEDLIAKADKALYMSKAHGRNHVTVLDDEDD